MTDGLNLSLILVAAFVASASPGPATLTLADTAMQGGRRRALALASGITTGSLAWSLAAALGLGALMLANAWAFEVLRYAGAGYLMFLAVKSARSAVSRRDRSPSRPAATGSWTGAYLKGLALHLTNPKPILFFGSLYALGVPRDASASDLAIIIAAVGLQSFVIFHVYALVFSHPRFALGYRRVRRWLEGAFAIAFGAASLKLLTTRIS